MVHHATEADHRPPERHAPTYRLLVRPLPDATDPEGYRRLRALLKTMLRGYRIRCCSFEAVTTADVATADAAERSGKEASV